MAATLSEGPYCRLFPLWRGNSIDSSIFGTILNFEFLQTKPRF